MERILILTPGSWKSIDQIKQTTAVYRVAIDMQCTVGKIDHWLNIDSFPTYAAWNRYDQQSAFFAAGSEVFYQRLDDQQWYTLDGKSLYQLMNTAKIFLADRPSFAQCDVRRSISVNEINHMVRVGKLNTTLIDGPSNVAAQTLYAWKQTYGSFRAKDWNQALMLQALLIKTGTTSNIVKNNGIEVVPSPRDRFDVTDLVYCKELSIDRQPVDKDGNIVHVIANYKGMTFIL